MGNVIKKLGWRRSDLVISTKIFFGAEGRKGPNDRGLSRKHIIEGLNDSLKRLQLDYVDLLFCHRPDPTVPIDETVRAMNDVIHQGKAFYWGTSEWNSYQIRDAIGISNKLGLIPPQVEQPQYNMFCRSKVDKDYLSLYNSSSGLGLTTWSPLASGLLTCKYNEGIPKDSRLAMEENQWLKDQFNNNSGLNGLEEKDKDTVLSKVKALAPIAKELDVSLSQLSIAWCLKNKHVSSVILGASKTQQVTENLKSLSVVTKLTDDVMARIEKVLQNAPPKDKDWRAL